MNGDIALLGGSDGDDREGGPDQAGETPEPDGKESLAPGLESRTGRRTVVKAGVVVAGAVVGAYVKPSLTRIAIPTALAASGGPPPTPHRLTGTGCTPGFWKNISKHGQFWVTYTPSTTLGSVFTLPPSFSSIANDTFLTALSYGGGSSLLAKGELLLHQAVAALLNVTAGLSYPPAYNTTAKIISAVNGALANPGTAASGYANIIALQTTLSNDNSGTCNTP